MIPPKVLKVILILVGAPILAFLLQDLFRGTGNLIAPYLWTAFATAAIITVVLTIILQQKDVTSRWTLIWNSWVAIALFFIISGPLVVIAENIAAYRWEASGEPLGDHGSYHEFYPGDSGMAHHPTRILDILGIGLLSSIIWVPFSGLLLWLATLSTQFTKSMKPIKSANKAQ